MLTLAVPLIIFHDSEIIADSNIIAVIVSKESDIKQLAPRQISDIYLARRNTFPTGEPAEAFDQPWNAPLREAFFKRLNGMNMKQLNAYWARLRFSGNIQPSPTMEDNIKMKNAVSENRYAIGYIPLEFVDESVHVVLLLN